MSIDVEIFMNKIIKFFRENPNELYNLIPKGQEEYFFSEIRKKSTDNVERGEDATLTQKQIIEICVIINGNQDDKQKSDNVFFDTIFGKICLN